MDEASDTDGFAPKSKNIFQFICFSIETKQVWRKNTKAAACMLLSDFETVPLAVIRNDQEMCVLSDCHVMSLPHQRQQHSLARRRAAPRTRPVSHQPASIRSCLFGSSMDANNLASSTFARLGATVASISCIYPRDYSCTYADPWASVASVCKRHRAQFVRVSAETSERRVFPASGFRAEASTTGFYAETLKNPTTRIIRSRLRFDATTRQPLNHARWQSEKQDSSAARC